MVPRYHGCGCIFPSRFKKLLYGRGGASSSLPIVRFLGLALGQEVGKSLPIFFLLFPFCPLLILRPFVASLFSLERLEAPEFGIFAGYQLVEVFYVLRADWRLQSK